MEPVRIGIVGCGAVSKQYLPNLTKLPGIEILGVADVQEERAREAAETYPGLRVMGVDDLIAADGLELVVNLTNLGSHLEISTAALEAGRHVYSEKSLGADLAQATALVDLAEARGLTLTCAPDTTLGCAFQSARDALRAGAIGEPMTATGVMLRHELHVPGVYPKGLAQFLDMGPYYVSAVTELLGPSIRVTGRTRSLTAEESVDGQGDRPVVSAGVLENAAGVMSDVTLTWGTQRRQEVAYLTVFGTEGVMRMPNPNVFDEPAFVRGHDEDEWHEVPGSRQDPALPRNLRGLGVAAQADAIRNGSPVRVGGELARHVVDIITGVAASSETGHHVELTTTCEPSAPLGAEERDALLGDAVRSAA